MEKPKIAVIVGSLRKDSYNRQLAMLAKNSIADRANFEIIEYADVPFMNQDIEYPAPESVARVREAILQSNGVWFFSPEYNHSIPGVLKNLIDWLSRPVSAAQGQVLSKKPAAISGATRGTSGTMVAQDHLVALISLLNMRVMNYPRLTISNLGDQLNAQGRVELTSSRRYLEKQIDAFLRFL